MREQRASERAMAAAMKKINEDAARAAATPLVLYEIWPRAHASRRRSWCVGTLPAGRFTVSIYHGEEVAYHGATHRDGSIRRLAYEDREKIAASEAKVRAERRRHQRLLQRVYGRSRALSFDELVELGAEDHREEAREREASDG